MGSRRGGTMVVGATLAAGVFAAGCGAPASTSTTSSPALAALEARLPARPTDGQPAELVVAPVTDVAAAPTSAPRPLRHAVVVFTGDTLLHSPLVAEARRTAGGDGYDFAPMFAGVRPIIASADLAVCHLETPIAPPGEALSTAPRYGVPAQIAPALAGAGYDRCSTASNHSMDRGAAGIDSTIAALHDAGLSVAGTARTETEAVTTVLVDVNGIEIAHLSYTFGLNGLRRPEDEAWRVNLIADGTIVDAARQARAQGADVVVVSLHWGAEGVVSPTRYQTDVANWITATHEIDLVVGHHAHVPQPVAKVNDTWVAYGLGNFLSNMPTDGPTSWPASSQDGVILGVRIDEQPDGTFSVGTPSITPTWVDRQHGWLIRPVLTDLADPTVDAVTKRQLQRSLDRATAVFGDLVRASP